MAYNVLWLCVRRGFESTKVESLTKVEECKTAQSSTNATLAQNQCCAIVLFVYV